MMSDDGWHLNNTINASDTVLTALQLLLIESSDKPLRTQPGPARGNLAPSPWPASSHSIASHLYPASHYTVWPEVISLPFQRKMCEIVILCEDKLSNVWARIRRQLDIWNREFSIWFKSLIYSLTTPPSPKLKPISPLLSSEVGFQVVIWLWGKSREYREQMTLKISVTNKTRHTWEYF